MRDHGGVWKASARRLVVNRIWTGKLETDHWDRPIVDGWPVELAPYVGQRVEIIIRVVGDDPESYEALAKRHAGEVDVPQYVSSVEAAAGTAPATESTHSVSRLSPAEAARILYPSVRDV